MICKTKIQRLMQPKSIAVVGGAFAAEVIRQCRKLDYQGEIWPVNPKHATMEGLACFDTVEALPSAPDACFIAAPKHATVDIVKQLAEQGAGGAVCYAAGFSEEGEEGAALQQQLVDNAGDMPLVGPNCYGLINYVQGAALWPDQHGGERLDKGVAILTQSGNMGISLTMQQRALSIAYMLALGNQANTQMHDYIEILLEDPKVTAIGLHIETLPDIAAFSQVALKALQRSIPIVALKTGRSELGANATLSHTSSLAGADDLYDAMFTRYGISRVDDLEEMIETLKLLSITGPLHNSTLASMSCSGGEAALVADLADSYGLTMPAFSDKQKAQLQTLLTEKVHVANPLDYHTYIWGDEAQLTDCFHHVLASGFDITLLVLDYTKPGICDLSAWETTERAMIAAANATGGRAAIVSTLPDNLPAEAQQRLMQAGVVPMQGLKACLKAIQCANRWGTASQQSHVLTPLPTVSAITDYRTTWDEWNSKQLLKQHGIKTPLGDIVNTDNAIEQAEERLGYPLVIKALSADLSHKTEAGGVILNINSAEGVRQACQQLTPLSDSFLLEQMAQSPVAEVILGINRDPDFGLFMVVGAGGIWVEMLKDSQPLLLPCSRADIEHALSQLKIYPMLQGFRGKPAGDIDALVETILQLAELAQQHTTTLDELDINPLLVLEKGKGVVAVDALVKADPSTLETQHV